MIPIVFFSKELKGQSIPQLIETLHRLKCDGVDLCVRDGYAVNPDNVKTELPKATKLIREAGLKIPMVTASTDLTDPNLPVAERMLSACHDAGVALMKPGYWPFQEKVEYWKQVDRARKDVEVWEKKATAQGVRLAMHTHSGYNMGLNAAAMLHLVRGFNPAHIGVYLDTTHLLLHGEPLPMAIDMVLPYLCIIGAKDTARQRQANKPGAFVATLLGEGMVNFPELIKAMRERAIEVPLTIHSEYEATSEADRIAKVTQDVTYLRKIVSL